MKIKKGFEFFLIALILITFASCGGGGVGGSGAVNMKATAQKDKQVVASLQKPTPLERMWAFLSGKEATAAHAGCDTDKSFGLLGGGSVCIEKAYVVFDEIELEREDQSSGSEDEREFGPFVVDLLGVVPDDRIPGNILITVPANEAFNEIKFKIDDLDDDDNDGLNSNDDDHDGIDNDKDDIPVNVSLADIPPGLVKRSLLITGSATDGTSGSHKDFTFRSDIEARAKIKFDNNQTIADGSTVIAALDLTTAFGNLAFSNITATMEALFSSLPGPPVKCDANGDNIVDAGLSPERKLACDIVKDIELFEDLNNNNDDDPGEFLGDDDDPGEVDDSGSD